MPQRARTSGAGQYLPEIENALRLLGRSGVFCPHASATHAVHRSCESKRQPGEVRRRRQPAERAVSTEHNVGQQDATAAGEWRCQCAAGISADRRRAAIGRGVARRTRPHAHIASPVLTCSGQLSLEGNVRDGPRRAGQQHGSEQARFAADAPESADATDERVHRRSLRSARNPEDAGAVEFVSALHAVHARGLE